MSARLAHSSSSAISGRSSGSTSAAAAASLLSTSKVLACSPRLSSGPRALAALHGSRSRGIASIAHARPAGPGGWAAAANAVAARELHAVTRSSTIGATPLAVAAPLLLRRKLHAAAAMRGSGLGGSSSAAAEQEDGGSAVRATAVGGGGGGGVCVSPAAGGVTTDSSSTSGRPAAPTTAAVSDNGNGSSSSYAGATVSSSSSSSSSRDARSSSNGNGSASSGPFASPNGGRAVYSTTSSSNGSGSPSADGSSSGSSSPAPSAASSAPTSVAAAAAATAAAVRGPAPPPPPAFLLQSGASMLPHPEKAHRGGEDAFFISDPPLALGVADGVGGWAEVGVDAGAYARLLMDHAREEAEALLAAASSNGGGSGAEAAAAGATSAAPTPGANGAGAAPPLSPQTVLERAYYRTNVQGSSTACVLALNGSTLCASNLGDSGFIIVRGGTTAFQSPQQQHNFNFPFQLGSADGGASDHPGSAMRFELAVRPGDIVVTGTDGLWDNVFAAEASAIVSRCRAQGDSPEAAAHALCRYARARALDPKHQSPFSLAALQAGYAFLGGKLDDITVVVSYVTQGGSKL